MTIAEFLHLLRHRLWSTCEIILLVRSPDTPLPKHAISCPGEFRDVTEENIRDCGQFEDISMVSVYRKMLSDGFSGQYGYLNGACVYRAWTQHRGKIDFEGCTVMSLPEHAWYSCYVYCAPEARGNGFHRAGIAETIRQFPDETAYTMILPEKPWSMRNYILNGFKPYSSITAKNRFLHRSLCERLLSPDEISACLFKLTQRSNDP